MDVDLGRTARFERSSSGSEKSGCRTGRGRSVVPCKQDKQPSCNRCRRYAFTEAAKVRSVRIDRAGRDDGSALAQLLSRTSSSPDALAPPQCLPSVYPDRTRAAPSPTPSPASTSPFRAIESNLDESTSIKPEERRSTRRCRKAGCRAHPYRPGAPRGFKPMVRSRF